MLFLEEFPTRIMADSVPIMAESVPFGCSKSAVSCQPIGTRQFFLLYKIGPSIPPPNVAPNSTNFLEFGNPVSRHSTSAYLIWENPFS